MPLTPCTECGVHLPPRTCVCPECGTKAAHCRGSTVRSATTVALLLGLTGTVAGCPIGSSDYGTSTYDSGDGAQPVSEAVETEDEDN